jgi:hypothetical protein
MAIAHARSRGNPPALGPGHPQIVRSSRAGFASGIGLRVRLELASHSDGLRRLVGTVWHRGIGIGVWRKYVRVMEVINLGEADGLAPVDWAGVTEKLDTGSAPAPDGLNSRTTWLSTVNEDGSPHVTAVGALWLDGTFWFQTGTGTRKGRNVARDVRCSVAVSIRDADVVFEGEATRVTDPSAIARIAKAWAESGWPAEPDESGTGITAPFNAPSQGPPPWNVYRIEPRSATVVLSAEPGGLTRFRF